MDDEVDATPLLISAESELNEFMGLFDAPAFARRGLELEYAIDRLRQRIGREREAMLDMVRLRLRQWASASAGPDDWIGVFGEPIDSLWPLAGSENPSRGGQAALARRRRASARDLTASVARFNRRWTEFLDRLSLEKINRQIDAYNRYYVLEKECVLGSSRLAARHFETVPRLTRESLLAEFPTFPIPKPLP